MKEKIKPNDIPVMGHFDRNYNKYFVVLVIALFFCSYYIAKDVIDNPIQHDVIRQILLWINFVLVISIILMGLSSKIKTRKAFDWFIKFCFFLTIVLCVFQIWLLDNISQLSSSNIDKGDLIKYQAELYGCTILSIIIIFATFTYYLRVRKEINEFSFILGLFQVSISMTVASTSNVDFLILKILSNIIYLAIPAFAVYAITELHSHPCIFDKNHSNACKASKSI